MTANDHQVPGPPALPLLGHLPQLRRDVLGLILRGVRDHGDLVRFQLGPAPVFLVNHPDDVARVLKGNAANYDKETRSTRLIREVCGAAMLTTNGAGWARRRQLLGPLFRPDAVAALEPVMLAEAEAAAARWRGAGEVDCAPAMMAATFRVVARAMFGADLPESSVAALERPVGLLFAETFARLGRPWGRRSRAFRDALAMVDALVQQLVAGRRRAGQRQPPDLLDTLLARCTDAEVRDEAVAILLAGHETTAGALTWLLALLARHPAEQARCAADPAALDRALLEAMRLYPPIWIIERRVIAADTLAGHTIPSGAAVVICPFALHRHPAFWQEPDEFRPDRFLAPPPPAFLPFGAGPRACLGREFALAEARIIAGRLLAEFEFSLLGRALPAPLPAISLRVRGSLRLGVAPRDGCRQFVGTSAARREAKYDVQAARSARLSGAPLRLAAVVLESPLRRLLLPGMLRDAGVTRLRGEHVAEPPTFTPLHGSGAGPDNLAAAGPVGLPPVAAPPAAGFRFECIHDYARAYRDGATTPLEVAERALQAIESSDRANPPLRAMIAVHRDDALRQAEAATRRIRDGAARGLLDGVPVAVKDELDMVPYPTTVGTAFLGRRTVAADATAVARLRAAGAILLGKANMHEIGIGVTGLNPIHGTPRNPYAPDRHTGGSSSGSATAVAAGLCPVALAADGGGSIRIPAALCGLVGLKPTYGRVSEHGAAALCPSVAHLGPIAATATDAAIGYAVIAGPDPHDPISLRQPPPVLTDLGAPGLRGIRLGVFRPWFGHASSEVLAACEAMLENLLAQGAELHEVAIPGLEAARVAHAVTICTEMAQAMGATAARHRREHSPEVRATLAIAGALTTNDYLLAQRVRTRLIADFLRVLENVDAVVTPTTAIVAPPIRGNSLASGAVDLALVGELMRFATPANLTGLPAVSFPAGYTPTGLPVGLQAIGRPWEEPLLLRIALAAETGLERQAPVLHHRLLNPQG